METVEVEGLKIAFERAGHGPPLVLVHGFVGDSRTFRHQLDGLSDEFTVIAWDGPGSGNSPDPPDSWRISEFADCLAAFIAALGLERPHVGGLSFGGAMVLELYNRHPKIPASLVLAAAYAGWAGSLPPDVVSERLNLSLKLAGMSPDDLIDTLMPTMFSKAPPPGTTEEFARAVAEFHPAGFRAMALASAEADLRAVLPRIEVPTLLLFGDEDVRAPLDVANYLHANIPDSKLVVLPGVGHVNTIEAPDRFNAEVRHFLHSVSG